MFFFQAEDGIRDDLVTGVQTCALPISGGFSGAAFAAGVTAGGLGEAGFVAGITAGWVDEAGFVPRLAVGAGEIGRAACRERVEISGVPVSLKKKKWRNRRRRAVRCVDR